MTKASDGAEPLTPEKWTSEELLASHPITKALKGRGFTDQELSSVRFFKPTPNRFPNWAITFDRTIPAPAASVLLPYCILRWLYLENPPSSADTAAAWNYLATKLAASELSQAKKDMAEAAPLVAIGKKHGRNQAVRAGKPRGRLSPGGDTVGDILERVVLNPEYEGLRAKELWPHFIAALVDEGTDAKEVAGQDASNPTCLYYVERPVGRTGKAEGNGLEPGERKMSFKQFSNRVSKFRKKKSA